VLESNRCWNWQKVKVTLAQFALAWTIHQPGITSPIIGPRTVEQLEDNLGALSVEFSPYDFERIDSTLPPGTHVAPFYEAQFGPSVYRW
jgi:aryl-alcohol dehydrogenase-like predicted oxidoreductase